MRVSTAYGYDQISARIAATSSRMTEAQNRVTSGKRIEKPSDDATGTLSLLKVTSLRAGLARYGQNLTTANSTLTAADSAYSDIGDLVQEARTIAISGATATQDASTRQSMVSQVEALQKQLVTLGNSQGPDGRYLMGGRMTDAAPFTVAADGTLSFAGDAIAPTAEIGPNQSIAVGEASGDMITGLYNTLASLKQSLQAGDTTSISNVELKSLETYNDQVVSARGDVGVRMDQIQTAQDHQSRRDDELAARQSDIGEVDYADAIVKYSAAQNAYQAALTVASKGFSMGLMDFIQ